MDKKAIAHVRQLEDGTWAEPQGLGEHLEHTAELAAEFARAFDSSAWARACGMAHDMGKSTEAWQEYLARKSGYGEEDVEAATGTLDHSTPGAKLAEDILGRGTGRILSYCIAGCYGHACVVVKGW